jgi:hypothetical protein
MGSQFAPLFAIKDPSVAHELQRLFGLINTLKDTLADVEDTLRAMDVSYLSLPVALTAEPDLRWPGMIVRADRATWDPLSKGSGTSYLCWWNGTAWAMLDTQ